MRSTQPSIDDAVPLLGAPLADLLAFNEILKERQEEERRRHRGNGMDGVPCAKQP